jgi:hypothetical protein
VHQQGCRYLPAKRSTRYAERAGLDNRGFRQQFHARPGGKAFADQEVAIAGDEADARPHVGRAAQQVADFLVERGVEVVVADPVFEQVAEDEQHLDVGRGRVGQEYREALRQVRPLLAQVQVGDETGGSGDGEHLADT